MMNMTQPQLKTPLLTGEDATAKRAELKAYFLNSWNTYESLFSLINNDDAFYKRPEPLRHPLIFYYGHTATFYINKLMLALRFSQLASDVDRILRAARPGHPEIQRGAPLNKLGPH